MLCRVIILPRAVAALGALCATRGCRCCPAGIHGEQHADLDLATLFTAWSLNAPLDSNGRCPLRPAPQQAATPKPGGAPDLFDDHPELSREFVDAFAPDQQQAVAEALTAAAAMTGG